MQCTEYYEDNFNSHSCWSWAPKRFFNDVLCGVDISTSLTSHPLPKSIILTIHRIWSPEYLTDTWKLNKSQ